jgi:putative ABC transport system substrate-binding protein
MMRRREYIAGLGAALAAWPLETRAQQLRRIAFMSSSAASDPDLKVEAFQRQLESRGWVVGRNLVIDRRFGVDNASTASAAVSELLKLSPDVILAGEGAALAAAQRATGSIPIVFTGVSEPVTRGFVQSLSHPGGNITGFANLEPSFGAKWLELLKEIAPNVQRVAVVFSPALSGAQLFYRSIEAAAGNFSGVVTPAHVQSPVNIESEIEAFGRTPNGGLINIPDGFSDAHIEIFVAQTARFRLPAR